MNEGKEKEDIPREEKAGCSLILRIGRVYLGRGKAQNTELHGEI